MKLMRFFYFLFLSPLIFHSAEAAAVRSHWSAKDRVAPSVIAQERFRKYNTPKALLFHLNQQKLEEIRRLYHESPVSNVVRNILALRESDSNFFINQAPEYFVWNQVHNTFLVSNPSYIRSTTILEARSKGQISELKKSPVGIALTSWFVHPELQKNLNLDENLGVKDLEKNGTPYLTTLLDLDQSHIAYLEELKTLALEMLKKRFEVSEEVDKVELYFHFPTAVEYSTLHLHVRANSPSLPLEQMRSYSLDEILDYLKSGRTVQELILNRQMQKGSLLLPTNSGSLDSIVKQVNGSPLDEVINPFFVNP